MLTKNILIADFKGNNNSAKRLLDNIKKETNIDKLYLANSFNKSESQFIEKYKCK